MPVCYNACRPQAAFHGQPAGIPFGGRGRRRKHTGHAGHAPIGKRRQPLNFLYALQGIRSPVLTLFFRFVTAFGEETILVLVLCTLYWCLDKEMATGVAISFFVSTLLVQCLKIAVRIERPWVLDPAFLPVAEALGTATGYSFPSGHTQSAAAIFGYLGLASRRKGPAIAAWALVALVGLSRMYLGVHTPLDVLGAMVLSLVVSLITLRYVRRSGSLRSLLAVLLALSAAALALAFSLHARGIIDKHYLADCCKAAGGCIGCGLGLLWAKTSIPFNPRAGVLWQQAIKLLLGIAGLLIIRSGIKALLGSHLAIDALRYGLIAFFALALYPLLFAKVLERPAKAA